MPMSLFPIWLKKAISFFSIMQYDEGQCLMKLCGQDSMTSKAFVNLEVGDKGGNLMIRHPFSVVQVISLILIIKCC